MALPQTNVVNFPKQVLDLIIFMRLNRMVLVGSHLRIQDGGKIQNRLPSPSNSSIDVHFDVIALNEMNLK